MKTGEINIHDGSRPRKVVDEFDLGMDVGSVSVNLVVMTPAGEVLREEYRRHLGQPQNIALELLSSLEAEFPLRNCRLAGFTGLGGQALAEVFGGTLVNEVIAQARAHTFWNSSPRVFSLPQNGCLLRPPRQATIPGRDRRGYP
jgi:activator of 2-hydroxyglutaryl-CoA dehydratase